MRQPLPLRGLLPLLGLFAGAGLMIGAADTAVQAFTGGLGVASDGAATCTPLCLAQSGGGYGGGGRTDPRDRARERGGAREKADKPAPSEIEPSWLERMPGEDRQPMEALVGFAPPAFPQDLEWLNGERLTWDDLRGKVVVIQSWTGRTAGGRAQPQKAQAALKDFKPEDVVLLALHTPDGADKAEDVAKNAAAGIRVVVDPSGAFCDELGIFKRPANLVIDRDGAVRAAGLTQAGITKAVELYVKRPVTPDAAPPTRDQPQTPPPSEVRWPTFSTPAGSARDLRGQQAPSFQVADWYTDEPSGPNGRMLLVDFFASWCGPCLAAIPHMNDLARSYGRDVWVVAISDESKRALSDGLMRRNRKASDFGYAVGVDPTRRMYSAFQVRGIPYCAVISTDGIVRWQGHPTQLTAGVMDQLVAAHRAATGGSGSGGGSTAPPKRWQAEKVRK